MFSWIAENISTIIICAALTAIVAIIILGIINNRKKGKSSCGCSCNSCPMSRNCHQKK